MPPRDPGRLALVAAGLALAALLVVALVLIELLVDAPSRRTAIRLAAGAVLALAALRIRTLVRLRLGGQPRSTFEVAGEPVPPPKPERSRFDQLLDEVRFSARSQRYFDAVLWPRLCGLASATPAEPPPWLPKPPGRSFGRGPSLAALEGLIASIEGRR